MKKLLLTGASGFLGWNICRRASAEWQVVGVRFSHDPAIPGARILKADLTRYADVKSLFSEARPDGVIHAAAASDPAYCEAHASDAHRINVEASIHIAVICADHGIPCVFTSSDLLFDGLSPPYREEDPVSPINVYGRQKAEAEREMLERNPRVAICRMPLMFGDAGPTAESFIQPMIETLQAGGELRLFTDEVRTPLSAVDAVDGIFMALASLPGIVHLGGPERISRYDFGRLLADCFGFRDPKLIPCRQRDIKTATPRPPDVSLDNTRARSMGFRPKPLREALEDLARSLSGKPRSVGIQVSGPGDRSFCSREKK